MNWKNLTLNKCPKCSKDLFVAEEELVINCSNNSCDFKIGVKRFGELSSSITEEKLDRENRGVDNLDTNN